MKIKPTKSEAILFPAGRAEMNSTLKIDGQYLELKREVKYLGIWLDQKLKWQKQISSIAAKAARLKNRLATLFGRARAISPEDRRRINTAVLEPKLTYGCEVWAECLKYEKYCKILNSAQRGLLIWTVNAYRTCSRIKARYMTQFTTLSARCKAIRAAHTAKKTGTVRIGPLSYNKDQNGKWKGQGPFKEYTLTTRHLKRVVGRHYYAGEEPRMNEGKPAWIDFTDIPPINVCGPTTTQFLTGHGAFGEYLSRMNIISASGCVLCGNGIESAEHLMLHCQGTSDIRRSNYITREGDMLKLTHKNTQDFT